ncbi:hypothetical protein [Pelagimonas varians]|uniref:Uncharacterized protein n=1 Tax=Pelagimonas varians TaxID=696760 RepID=A0A238K8L7_9RHOB|nr:hypothetical protein [Pelagimonas varians]PYG31925.1 hypothetical protein C8N36_104350 [Pelagimonas varians]SMX38432.1 hypothetical protein PEV8663_01294 [Pelagimonas varians]
MGLERATEKLDKYYSRLESGKAAKIKPSHVMKVIAKLQAKQALLQEELAAADKPSKQDRLENKLVTVGTQLERAHWLLDQIGS